MQASTSKRKNNINIIIDKINNGISLTSEEYQDFLKIFKINYNPEKSPNPLIQENNIYDDNIIMNEINEILEKIKNDNISLKKDIEWISKTVLPAIIGLGAILLTAMIFGFSSQATQMSTNMDSINKSIQSINQRLDDQYRYIDAKTQK